jgi:hypothetical protein
MALQSIQGPIKKKDGGLFGSILGGVASLGALAAPFTGGASSAITAATGLAGPISKALSSKNGSSGQPIPLLEKATRANPEVQLAQLVEARRASQNLSKNKQDEILNNFLNPAISHLKSRLG